MRTLTLAFLLSAMPLLVGCGTSGNFGSTPAPPPSTVTGTSAPPNPTVFHGIVHGGLAPVVGARVYLFAAGSTGYGAPAVSLLSSTQTGHSDAVGAFVVSDSVGAFSIASNAFSCPTGSQLYFLARGGNAGAGDNSAIGLLAAFGGCPPPTYTVGSAPAIWINEVTTVAAAYSLAAYAGDAADATHISSSGTSLAQTGVSNAFAALSNLVDGSNGHARGSTPNGNGSLPQQTVNTLSNALAACVNTASPGSFQCTSLAAASLPGSQNFDTASAALSIAHQPSLHTRDLFALQDSGGSDFTPALASAPSSWLLPITFSGGGLSAPHGVAIDASGNVWAANSGGVTLSKFSPLGVPAAPAGYGGGGLLRPYSVAIDAGGNAWSANTLSNSLSEVGADGTPISPNTGYTGGGLLYPLGLAFDKTGSVWVSNLYDSDAVLSRFSSQGVPLSSTGYHVGISGEMGDVQLDGTGNVWVSGFDDNVVSKVTPSPSPVASVFAGGGLSNAQGIAFDAAGNAWVADQGNSSLAKFSSAGVALSGTGISGGGLSGNRFLAIDGAGNVWTPSINSATVSEFTNAGVAVAPSGFSVSATSKGLWAAAIDGSGNVWLTSTDGNLIELLGAAAPVVTPLVTAATSGHLGVRP